MQFKKLSAEERRIKRWRTRRNALFTKILNDDPRTSRVDALKLANQMMRSK